MFQLHCLQINVHAIAKQKMFDEKFAFALKICFSAKFAPIRTLQLCWYLFSDHFGRVRVCFCYNTVSTIALMPAVYFCMLLWTLEHARSQHITSSRMSEWVNDCKVSVFVSQYIVVDFGQVRFKAECWCIYIFIYMAWNDCTR